MAAIPNYEGAVLSSDLEAPGSGIPADQPGSSGHKGGVKSINTYLAKPVAFFRRLTTHCHCRSAESQQTKNVVLLANIPCNDFSCQLRKQSYAAVGDVHLIQECKIYSDTARQMEEIMSFD